MTSWPGAGSIRRLGRLLLVALLAAAGGYGPAAWGGTAAGLKEALDRGGLVFLLRHAEAPGFGDPEGFRLGDCSTQRNLGEAGRAQARALGAAFRAAGIDSAIVLSSQWCRCLETAELLSLGEPVELETLNSLHLRPERVPGQTAELRRFIETGAFHLPAVLVTHQANIRALTGIGPRSGEIIALGRGGPRGIAIIGAIAAP